VGSTLMVIAAFFQLFDGIQTVTIGALRGLGDTHSAMLLNLISYWLLGLPLGYFLCFHLRMGAAGVWTGLSLSLVLLAATLLAVWRHHCKLLTIASVLETAATEN
jgi:MATE family multidrug resistance protein